MLKQIHKGCIYIVRDESCEHVDPYNRGSWRIEVWCEESVYKGILNQIKDYIVADEYILLDHVKTQEEATIIGEKYSKRLNLPLIYSEVSI